MIWGYIYIGLIVSATVYILWAGDWESRLAIATLVAGSALTLLAVYLSGQYFQSADLLLVSLDFLVFAAFFSHMAISRRYWTLILPALQLITCLTHLAKLTAPEIVPKVYSAGQGFWAYPQMAIILAAVYWQRTHTRREAARERAKTMSATTNGGA
jgi:hypothetical protein